jgi:tRNA (guanosine-2'-O-)-methyltransferase
VGVNLFQHSLLKIRSKMELDTLRSCVSEHKLQLIQRVLANRSRYISFVFEQFYHTHNMHAALRSIECFGFQDVYSIDNKTVSFQGLNITKGADFWLSFTRYNDTVDCFDMLKRQGYKIVGATPDPRAHALADIPLDQKIALVFGNEREGLSEYVLGQCDEFVTIPMYGFTQSFNASVSVALCAYELRRRLESTDIDWRISEQEKQDLELTWLKRLVLLP